MQLLPSSSVELLSPLATDITSSTQTQINNDSKKSLKFESIYSSYIEEGRTEYTGIPQGFSAHENTKGTISREEVYTLQEKLREKNADESSIEVLNQMIASGQPITLGSIFGKLSGTSRISEELTDDERLTLRNMFSRLNVSSEDTDELLSASDSGNAKKLWNTFSNKISNLSDDSFEVSLKELNALLKGLDVSTKVQKNIIAQFNKKEQTSSGLEKTSSNIEQLSLSKEEIRSLFAEVQQELTDKDNASQVVKGILREAVVSTLEESRLRKLGQPVASVRGSKLSSQKETLMQDSLMKKTGVDNLILTKDQDEEIKEENNKSFSHDNKEDQKQKLSNSEVRKVGTSTAKLETQENIAPQGFTSLGQTFSNQSVDQKDVATLAKNYRQEIFSQVEKGILQNTSDGSSSLTLQLTPNDLGKMTVILSVKEGEVKATIRAENKESAVVLGEQLTELKQALEDQGLKVSELEVRTGLQNNSDQNSWNNSSEHNMMKEAQDRDRMIRLAQLRRDAVNESSTKEVQVNRNLNRQNNLYVIA